MTDSEPAITLYRLQACPYCERVVRVLQDLDVPYQPRFVEALHSRRNAVKRVAGVRSVPVIVDERTGVTMAESANIVDYLESTYGTGAESESSAAAGSVAEAESGAESEATSSSGGGR